MFARRKIFILLLSLAAPFSLGSTEGWVEERLSHLTLREKIGQMIMVDIKGTTFDSVTKKHLEQGSFGNIILFERNLASRHGSKILIRELMNHAVVKTGIPPLIAVDQEGGLVNRISPITDNRVFRHGARKLGSIYHHSPKRAGAVIDAWAEQVARELNDIGFNMNLAPVLDMTSDTNSYIYRRSYSGDPHVVTNISRRFASAHSERGIATTGKHFPNLTTTRLDSHEALPYINFSLDRLRKHEFVPFRKLRNNLDAMMVGHVMLPKIDKNHPASLSPKIVSLLRRDIGYHGVIISDDIKMKALSRRYPAHEIALRSVNAGVDIIIVAWDKAKQLAAVEAVHYAVKKGRIPEKMIDASVRRILKLKYKLMTARETGPSDIDMENQVVPGY